MKTLLFQVLGLRLLFLAEPASAQIKDKAATEESARQRIIRNAPIVFLGRPLQGESYKDASGRIYESTVIQVLEVLRGDQTLKAGTVEFVDSLVQTPELESSHRFGGTNVYVRDYGVYFATASTYPTQLVPYQTTNGKLQLKAFRNDPQAKALVNYGSDGSIVEGLYRWWDSEASMLDYINKLPQMRPVAKLGNEQNYPYLYYHDKRLGGHDVFSPSIPVESQWPAAKDNVAAPVAPATEPAASGPSSSNFLPLDAFKQLPAVMKRIRTNQPLSKQDSLFIKTYLPEYAPKKPAPGKLKTAAPKAKKATGRVGGNVPAGTARLAVGDTTLTLSIRNLKTVKVLACGRAYQGELWLKANVAGVFMDQLYFEMSTTADLKYERSPFGPMLDAAYTPLAGAPGYTFYHSYDSTAKRILIVGYPSQTNPQRVKLATAAVKPFFRFRYTVADTLPANQPLTANFKPLATAMSRDYTNYYLSANPPDEQIYFPHQFTNLRAQAAAVVKRLKPFQIDSLHTANRALVTAGTGTLLTIYGSNFGSLVNPADTSQRSRIQFINADTVAGHFLRDVDRQDVIFWRDTLIQVRIPASVEAYQTSPRVVGGGVVRIRTYCDKITQSKDTLDILYNLANTSKRLGKARIYLASLDCSRGLTFRLNANLAAVPGAEAATRAALRSWSNQLGFPLVLLPGTVLNGPSSTDGVNTISLGNAGSAAMETFSAFRQAASTTTTDATKKPRWAKTDIDIVVSPTSNWTYDTTAVALCQTDAMGNRTNCQSDFYAAMLHELGHGLCLNHVVDPHDIMYYRLTFDERRSLTAGRQAAVAGAQRSVGDSRAIHWNSTTIGTFGQPLASCSTQNRQANPYYEAAPVPGLIPSLYPNPLTDQATLIIPAAQQGPVDYWVLDAQGRTVVERHTTSTNAATVGQGLPAGLYLVRVRTVAGTTTLRMVKSN